MSVPCRAFAFLIIRFLSELRWWRGGCVHGAFTNGNSKKSDERAIIRQNATRDRRGGASTSAWGLDSVSCVTSQEVGWNGPRTASAALLSIWRRDLIQGEND